MCFCVVRFAGSTGVFAFRLTKFNVHCSNIVHSQCTLAGRERASFHGKPDTTVPWSKMVVREHRGQKFGLIGGATVLFMWKYNS